MTAETIEKPAPAPLAVVTVATNSGSVTVPCEPVGEWLAITPVFGMDGEGNTVLDGRFRVTHRPTGRDLGDGAGCIACCRHAAAALNESGADWSTLTVDNSGEVSAGWSAEVKTAVMHARAVEWLCGAEVCAPRTGDSDSEGER